MNGDINLVNIGAFSFIFSIFILSVNIKLFFNIKLLCPEMFFLRL